MLCIKDNGGRKWFILQGNKTKVMADGIHFSNSNLSPLSSVSHSLPSSLQVSVFQSLEDREREREWVRVREWVREWEYYHTKHIRTHCWIIGMIRDNFHGYPCPWWRWRENSWERESRKREREKVSPQKLERVSEPMRWKEAWGKKRPETFRSTIRDSSLKLFSFLLHPHHFSFSFSFPIHFSLFLHLYHAYCYAMVKTWLLSYCLKGEEREERERERERKGREKEEEW